MEKCNIRLSKIKNKNKKKHCLTKKLKKFSTLIMNNYIVRNPEIDKLKDISQPYYNNHKKKFDMFSVFAMWMKEDVLIKRISVRAQLH